ncbi:multidrug effflux MFS transporter [Actibacterium lipolyticum]|uniref:Bcr/CflA family efflux transporter n=1 Tax=Actibacterium lipolyticum TaxID=1524263 RepID=A0A238JW42_9RHOB|nr:multidrug effflux MFS transporter [Actibacterium lipolyticum]SMX34417.1 Bicyclomycin resistance protein [Actibacterium lipolyticum]
MSSGLFRSAIVLGLLSMVGPFAIDMYLPAMPEIASDLGATEAATQTTITAYFIAYGIAQLVYGPLADQVGRRWPLFIGVGIFLIASVGAAMADTMVSLCAWRAFQGLGGAVVMVVPRAIIRDTHTGVQATKLMAMIMLVISISPMLAPLAGSAILAIADWRAIFLVLAATALLSLALTATMQPETLAPEHRVKVNLRNMIKGGRILLTDANFMGLTFIGGFGMASFFVFIASAAFVYTGQYGLSPTGFSIAFAINAIGFFSASQMAGPLAAKFGLNRVILCGVGLFALFSAALATVALLGLASLHIVVALLFLANAGLGVVIPTTMVMALEEHGEIAGLASSLGGTLQMISGGIMIVAMSPFFDGTIAPMSMGIALCGLLALACTLLTFRRANPAAA